MSKIINVYCDESCHLQNDESKVMVLGAVWCLKEHDYLVVLEERRSSAFLHTAYYLDGPHLEKGR